MTRRRRELGAFDCDLCRVNLPRPPALAELSIMRWDPLLTCGMQSETSQRDKKRQRTRTCHGTWGGRARAWARVDGRSASERSHEWIICVWAGKARALLSSLTRKRYSITGAAVVRRSKQHRRERARTRKRNQDKRSVAACALPASSVHDEITMGEWQGSSCAVWFCPIVGLSSLEGTQRGRRQKASETSIKWQGLSRTLLVGPF